MEVERAKNKKPFDKKKWREQRYSLKQRVLQWREQREEATKRHYFRMLQKESKAPDARAARADVASSSASYNSVKQGFEKRQKLAVKREAAEQKRRAFLEKQQAMAAYKAKRAEKFKILSRKTKKGQPVMAGRMQMLLEKIKALE